MRRELIGAGIICVSVIVLLTGCAHTKKVSRDIAQLKGQMLTVEKTLATQAIMIQQNKEALASLSAEKKEEKEPVAEKKPYVTGTPLEKGAPASVVSSIISDALIPKPAAEEVQKALRNAGVYSGELDGKIGAMTRASVRKFQESKGLNADGIIGPKTWDELKKYL